MSLSAHMVDSFERKPSYAPYTSSRPPRPTMPQTPFTPFGADQSFAGDSWIEGHGYPPPRPSGSVGGFSRWSEEKVAALQVRLAKKLGPEFVTQRPGPGGGPKLSYVEGWKVINLANEVFGFNGWSSSIVSLTTDFLDVNDQGRVSVNVTAIVRITLADGCWHEDVGCGQGENIKSKGGALDKAKKEAVTDATKRALKTFGNVLGNCLYDKEYTKEIVKIKVPPTKFGTHDLERRPEFAEPSASGPSRQTASAVPSHMSNVPKPVIPTHQTPQQPARNETVNPRPGTPIRDINDLSDGDFFMDENYDAEFAGLDEQSLINQSTSKQNISPTKPQQQPPAAGPSRMGPPGVSEYHHRHRPDPPPTTNARPAPSAGGAAARQAALLAASAAEPAPLPDPPIKPNMSSGSSDTLFDTPTAQRRPPQGNPPPDGTSRPAASAPTAQSARALAIAAALANSARADSPRADSPRIPDGGINAVVAKTSNRIAASAVTLGLEKEVSVGAEDENTSGLAFGGFTSARGMKRSTSSGDKGAPQSPTKMSGRSEWLPPHLAGQQRRPLGELGVVPEGRGHGDNWEAKRPRGF